MTIAADDEKDPGQKKVAGLSLDELVRDRLEPFERVLKISTRSVVELERYDKRIFKTLRDFLCHCFVAETGLKPSQITLVVCRPDPTTVNYFFVPADPHATQVKVVTNLYDEINKRDLTIQAQHRQIEELRAEVRDLRWKR